MNIVNVLIVYFWLLLLLGKSYVSDEEGNDSEASDLSTELRNVQEQEV